MRRGHSVQSKLELTFSDDVDDAFDDAVDIFVNGGNGDAMGSDAF